MKERPMRERDYLLAPLIICAKEDKERKKAVRRANIQKGSKSPSIAMHIYKYL